MVTEEKIKLVRSPKDAKCDLIPETCLVFFFETSFIFCLKSKVIFFLASPRLTQFQLTQMPLTQLSSNQGCLMTSKFITNVDAAFKYLNSNVSDVDIFDVCVF
jgi:hypothetical protein